jgi:hypothetical protein
VTPLLVISLLAAAPLPPECEPPALHDAPSLKAFAQKSGTLSVGLDSVATWCFDSGGGWTGGNRAEGKKPKPIDGNAPAVGDCARALSSCEEAKAAMTDELKRLLVDALADLERPYRGQKYPPRRSGLSDRPAERVDCREKSRPELFAQAQARMDLARLASAVQNEYANYKTWLFARGLECAQTVKTNRVDPTRFAMSVDVPSGGQGGGASGVDGRPGTAGAGTDGRAGVAGTASAGGAGVTGATGVDGRTAGSAAGGSDGRGGSSSAGAASVDSRSGTSVAGAPDSRSGSSGTGAVGVDGRTGVVAAVAPDGRSGSKRDGRIRRRWANGSCGRRDRWRSPGIDRDWRFGRRWANRGLRGGWS